MFETVQLGLLDVSFRSLASGCIGWMVLGCFGIAVIFASATWMMRAHSKDLRAGLVYEPSDVKDIHELRESLKMLPGPKDRLKALFVWFYALRFSGDWTQPTKPGAHELYGFPLRGAGGQAYFVLLLILGKLFVALFVNIFPGKPASVFLCVYSGLSAISLALVCPYRDRLQNIVACISHFGISAIAVLSLLPQITGRATWMLRIMISGIAIQLVVIVLDPLLSISCLLTKAIKRLVCPARGREIATLEPEADLYYIYRLKTQAINAWLACPPDNLERGLTKKDQMARDEVEATRWPDTSFKTQSPCGEPPKQLHCATKTSTQTPATAPILPLVPAARSVSPPTRQWPLKAAIQIYRGHADEYSAPTFSPWKGQPHQETGRLSIILNLALVSIPRDRSTRTELRDHIRKDILTALGIEWREDPSCCFPQRPPILIDTIQHWCALLLCFKTVTLLFVWMLTHECTRKAVQSAWHYCIRLYMDALAVAHLTR